MILTLNSWALAYNPANDHYHIDQLGPQISANISQYLQGVQNNTYMLLGIYQTYDECCTEANKFRELKEYNQQLKRA